jgi:hypothetical protein
LSKNLENEDALPDVSASELEEISMLTFAAIFDLYATATTFIKTSHRSRRAKEALV